MDKLLVTVLVQVAVVIAEALFALLFQHLRQAVVRRSSMSVA
jgi:hypothetical protein